MGSRDGLLETKQADKEQLINIRDDLEIVSAGELLHVRVHGDTRQAAPLVYAHAIDRQVREFGRICVLMEVCQQAKRSAMAWWQTSRGDFKVVHCDPMKLDQAKQWLESGGHQEREECNHGIS